MKRLEQVRTGRITYSGSEMRAISVRLDAYIFLISVLGSRKSIFVLF